MFELIVAVLIGTPMLLFLAPWEPALETERRGMEKANESDAAAMASEQAAKPTNTAQASSCDQTLATLTYQDHAMFRWSQMNGNEIKLTERLQRGGYVIGDITPGADGAPGAQLGERWLSLAELHPLVSQDSEIEDKPYVQVPRQEATRARSISPAVGC